MITQKNEKFDNKDTLADVIRKAEETEGKYISTSIEFHGGSGKGRIYRTGMSQTVGMGEEYC